MVESYDYFSFLSSYLVASWPHNSGLHRVTYNAFGVGKKLDDTGIELYRVRAFNAQLGSMHTPLSHPPNFNTTQLN